MFHTHTYIYICHRWWIKNRVTGSIKYARQDKVDGPSVSDFVSVSLIGRSRNFLVFLHAHSLVNSLRSTERIRSGPRDQDENRTVKRVEHVKQEDSLLNSLLNLFPRILCRALKTSKVRCERKTSSELNKCPSMIDDMRQEHCKLHYNDHTILTIQQTTFYSYS